MIKLLRFSDFSKEQRDREGRDGTKHYQRIIIERILDDDRSSDRFAEIGAHRFFDVLTKKASKSIYVIDPYAHGGGCGLGEIPDNFPYPAALFRCLLGVNSAMIPDGLFDFTFSMSVIEHIGQAAAGYDCTPTDDPPDQQEKERNDFCVELFRTTKPGGVTWHTVDHAARNLSFAKNFMKAGFVPISDDLAPTTDECLNDPQAIRQLTTWTDFTVDISDEQRRLHAVLLMGFRRP